MREQNQKIYLLLAIGVTLFTCSLFILLGSMFGSNVIKDHEIKDLALVNITTQSVDLFWKGYSDNGGFKVLYKESNSSGLFEEVIPTQIFADSLYTNGYMYTINIDNLSPDSSYTLMIWNSSESLYEGKFNTLPVSDEILPPDPISGESFSFDWVSISDGIHEYIVRSDSNGSWSLDGNLLASEYDIEIYSSSNIDEENILSKYFSNTIYAADTANCDEISYDGVASDIAEKAENIQRILATLQGGGGGSPQYLRCYEDVYCEAVSAGVDPRWTLADWTHESNASDYQYPKTSLYEDFGVHCCGVPAKNFQAQLGFFLNLSHDPCNCGTNGCSKEEYYCCWANNYLFGNQTKQCTDDTWVYINSLLTYYNMVGKGIVGVNGLPMPLKGSGTNIECGSRDPIEIYKEVVSGSSSSSGSSTIVIGEENPPSQSGGTCCALKISGKNDFQGDYESTTSKSCTQIWDGKNVYGGSVEYALQLDGLDRNSCEKKWSGVCCDSSGGYQWVPASLCTKKVGEFSSYDSCMEAGGKRESFTLRLSKGYNFTSWVLKDASNIIMASDLVSNSSIALVAGFHNGVWDQLMFKEDGSIKGSDFELKSGQAYLITTTQETSLPFSGVRFKTFEWGSLKGWQFVPSDALDPYSNTKDVVLSFDNVNISQVALWTSELGRFDYFVYDVTGEKYGESVSFDESQGVFVKID